MTEHPRSMKLPEAQALAGRFVRLIGSDAEVVMIVGSVRRKRPEVHDVDVVVQPKVESRTKVTWFDRVTEEVNLVDRRIHELFETGTLAPRKKKNGTIMVGKGVAFLEFEGWPCDIYYARPETLVGLIQVRTGSAAFNQMLATRALHLGRRFHADGTGITDAEGKRRLDTGESEESIFEALEMRYYAPDEREIPLSG